MEEMQVEEMQSGDYGKWKRCSRAIMEAPAVEAAEAAELAAAAAAADGGGGGGAGGGGGGGPSPVADSLLSLDQRGSRLRCMPSVS